MYDYPSRFLCNLELTKWDKLRELAQEKGKPYIDREESIVINLKRKDWVISICKMYRKGVWELTLNAVQNPFMKLEKLREIKDKEWNWAHAKANELLANV